MDRSLTTIFFPLIANVLEQAQTRIYRSENLAQKLSFSL